MLKPQYKIKLSRDENWQMDRPHFHEDIEILLSLTTGGDYFVGTELYPIREGALFLFPEATLHKSIAQESYRRYVLHISPGTLRQFSTPQSDLYAFTRGITDCCRQLNRHQAADLTQKFQQLNKEDDSSFCGDVRKNILLMDFLATVFVLFETEDEPQRENYPDLERIHPIMEYIEENLTEPLSLDRLSTEFFINKYHMCHTFKSATGFSVMEYIINCRVLKARELLRQGLRVQDVGEQVGFQNNAHFIRTFGNLTGTSPKRYAKEFLAGVRVDTRT